jgi:hypothetical protein
MDTEASILEREQLGRRPRMRWKAGAVFEQTVFKTAVSATGKILTSVGARARTGAPSHKEKDKPGFKCSPLGDLVESGWFVRGGSSHGGQAPLAVKLRLSGAGRQTEIHTPEKTRSGTKEHAVL